MPYIKIWGIQICPLFGGKTNITGGHNVMISKDQCQLEDGKNILIPKE